MSDSTAPGEDGHARPAAPDREARPADEVAPPDGATPPDGAHPPLSPTLLTVYAVTLMAVLGVASVAPAFPAVAEVFDVSAARVGLLITAFTLPGVLLAPIMGALADRWGRRAVLAPALALFGLAGAACALAPDFRLLVALRFLQGVGAAPLGSLNVTLIGDLFHGRRQIAVMGSNAAVLSVGTASYPLIGGALAEIDWHAPFLLPLLALPVVLLAWRTNGAPEAREPEPLRAYFSRVRGALTGHLLGLMLASLLTFVVLYGSYVAYFPFLMDERFGASSTVIGLVFSSASVATAAVSLRLEPLTRALGRRGTLVVAYSLYVASMVLAPLLPGLWWLVIPALLFGAGNGLNISMLHSWIASEVGREVRAGIMSLNAMTLRLGQTLGPVIASAGYAVAGLNGAFATGAMGSVVLLGLGLVLTRAGSPGVDATPRDEG